MIGRCVSGVLHSFLGAASDAFATFNAKAVVNHRVAVGILCDGPYGA